MSFYSKYVKNSQAVATVANADTGGFITPEAESTSRVPKPVELIDFPSCSGEITSAYELSYLNGSGPNEDNLKFISGEVELIQFVDGIVEGKITITFNGRRFLRNDLASSYGLGSAAIPITIVRDFEADVSSFENTQQTKLGEVSSYIHNFRQKNRVDGFEILEFNYNSNAPTNPRFPQITLKQEPNTNRFYYGNSVDALNIDRGILLRNVFFQFPNLPSNINSTIDIFITFKSYLKTAVFEVEEEIEIDPVAARRTALSIDNVPVSYGKKHIITDKTSCDLFLDNNYLRTKNYFFGNEIPESNIQDNFRQSTLSYWSVDEEQKKFTFLKSSLSKNSYVPFEIKLGNENKSKIKNDGALFKRTNSIKLIPDKTAFTAVLGDGTRKFEEKVWIDYITGVKNTTNLVSGDETVSYDNILKFNQPFYDHTFLFDKPYNERSVANTFNPPNCRYQKIEAEVNFVVEDYLNIIKQNQYVTNILPNIYSLRSQINGGFNESNVYSHNTLNYKLDGVLKKIQDSGQFTTFDSAQYFDAWYDSAYSNENAASELQLLAQKFNNIILAPDEIGKKLYNEIEESSETFPLNIKLEFSNDGVGEFLYSMKSSKLSKKIMNEICSQETNNLSLNKVELVSFDNSVQTSLESDDRQDNFADEGASYASIISNTSIENINSTVYDLKQWLEQLRTDQNSLLGHNRFNSTRVNVFKDQDEQNTYSEFMLSLFTEILISKIKSITKKHFRTYEEVISGKPCYHDTIMYKISKHEVNTYPSPTPVQNIYIFNTDETDVIKYIDTQLKINKQYMYNVSAYVVVVGNEYEYVSPSISTRTNANTELQQDQNDIGIVEFDQLLRESNKKQYEQTERASQAEQRPVDPAELESNDAGRSSSGIDLNDYNSNIFVDSDSNVNFRVSNKPSLKILEIPYYSSNIVACTPRPPLPPMAEFFPYVGTDNQLLISLNTPSGQKRLVPFALNQDDQKIIDIMLQSQKPDENGRIEYRSDDNIKNFEVFRSVSKPRSYLDFLVAKKSILDNSISDMAINSPEVSFVDDILPNKKYYYMFRSIDVDNNISNPSQIYEVEIVNNDGAIYPIFRAFDFEEPEKKKKSAKNASKYIKISPTFIQQAINTQKSGLDFNNSILNQMKKVKLGINEEVVWDRKIKLRLTSRETGRKIDINMSFTYNPVYKTFAITDGEGEIIEASTLSEALSLLLIEQTNALI